MTTALKPFLGTILPGGAWRQDPLAHGLAGYWSADGTKSAIDLSGNNNHGTLVGDTHCVPGKFGHAWDFDGTGDGIKIAARQHLDNRGTFTYIAAVYLTTTATNVGAIVSKNAGQAAPYGKAFSWWIGKTYHNDVFYGLVKCATTNAEAWTDNFYGLLRNDGWHIVAMTYSSSDKTIRFYLDGCEVSKASDTPGEGAESDDNLAQMWIGNGGQYINQTFKDYIGFVLAYNRALSPAEIRTLYARGVDPFLVRQRQFRLPLIVAATSVAGGVTYYELGLTVEIDGVVEKTGVMSFVDSLLLASVDAASDKTDAATYTDAVTAIVEVVCSKVDAAAFVDTALDVAIAAVAAVSDVQAFVDGLIAEIEAVVDVGDVLLMSDTLSAEIEAVVSKVDVFGAVDTGLQTVVVAVLSGEDIAAFVDGVTAEAAVVIGAYDAMADVFKVYWAANVNRIIE
ncbi:MAG TPA: LamG domain-containing protein [Planctomycetes bacterium]|nr:LamG domain-containing protein [Planctomycetota bacterium]